MFANIPGRLLAQTDDTRSLRSAREATLAVAGYHGMVDDLRLFDKRVRTGARGWLLWQAGVQGCASGADRSGDPVMACQRHQEQGRDNGPEVEDQGVSVEKLVK
jgi:hypothetical protein